MIRTERIMKKIVFGILAHVDAGKTTLSEALLYRSGAVRKLGRVDHGDAFLDTDVLERARGITILAKQAVFPLGADEATLLHGRCTGSHPDPMESAEAPWHPDLPLHQQDGPCRCGSRQADGRAAHAP